MNPTLVPPNWIDAGLIEMVGAGGIQTPRRIETFDEPWLAITKSCFPSPLRSPTAIESGLVPAEISGVAGDVKPPAPSPRRIETLLLVRFAAAKSSLPSPLKSPTVMKIG